MGLVVLSVTCVLPSVSSVVFVFINSVLCIPLAEGNPELINATVNRGQNMIHSCVA